MSCLDWHPQTNKIISGSYDKNIFVWSYNSGECRWIPDLVVLSQKGPIMDVKWSERGDKFCVATGSKLVSTGYYDKVDKWWVCHSVKKHMSAVTVAKFDRSGLFILSGSTDLKAYVSSAYLPEVDDSFTYDNLSLEKVHY